MTIQDDPFIVPCWVWLEELAPHAPIDQAGPEAGCTIASARTMQTPIRKDRSWAARLWSRGPTPGWILARGSRSCVSWMADPGV